MYSRTVATHYNIVFNKDIILLSNCNNDNIININKKWNKVAKLGHISIQTWRNFRKSGEFVYCQDHWVLQNVTKAKQT